jgi:hypothetical protein
MRTLLQARFSLVQKQRDLQQAVCQLEDAATEHCFHIAQLWCLVLEDCESQIFHLESQKVKSFSSIDYLRKSAFVSIAGGVNLWYFRAVTFGASVANPACF